jgi:anti-anti-sigma factor
VPRANRHVPFRALIDRSDDRVLLALSGELSLEVQEKFEEGVRGLQSEPARSLVVDLSGLTAMDSTGAFLLLDLYKRVGSEVSVTVEGASPEIQGLFEAAGLDRILPIEYPKGGRFAGTGRVLAERELSEEPSLSAALRPHAGLPPTSLPPRRKR